MITEKQMKIVEAVNRMKAESVPLWATTVWIHSSDGHLFGRNATNQTICTIEEYNQCIEEMKYHYDIPKWCSYSRADKEPLTKENSDYSFYEKETFVYGQDVYVNDGSREGNGYKFGCISLSGNYAVLLGDGVTRTCPLDQLSSKLIKSEEDIELEEAKKKQVHDNAFIYSHYFKSIDKAREMFLDMQGCGGLAPVELKEGE